ncbi:retrotransposon protein, putative, ty1-copia subclass [Tanacetum coccineum]|uniref:Retrotransposon protein, putative, ty1-copia subclass n=1 Tax=Tanacetum coccineum TaxID=301880 RepID=A0ABQ5CDL7_9ASTR
MAANQTTNNNSIRNEQKLHHLEEAFPEAPPATATAAVRNTYTHRVAKQQEVACLMLEERQSVSTYVLKMKAYLDQMERLDYPMTLVLGVNMILTSLSKDNDQFVENYNMRDMGKTILKLHAMLKLAEKGIPKKTPTVLAIRQGQIQKSKSQARGKGKQRGKGKSKLDYDPKHKIPLPAKKEHLTKDTKCIFTIELFLFPKSNSWIYDTGCGTHICNTIQGLKGYQKLNKGALDLYVDNGNTTAVEAIGSFDLILPSGMILVLDNCHFSPAIPRGVISLSRLWDNGFRHKFMDNDAILVSKDNICYFNAFPRDGNLRLICIIIYPMNKRIEKLQHDGLLKSIDDESFDVCVSCISGKMVRKPFTHTSERADDLLGIIHSDVCGPFRTTSRECANYYVTFTDDFTRYDYVYLIKHKHEVFEMFKTFEYEVENQLGKTIKALRSD